MQHLIEQEKFELEVLDKLNTKRILEKLIFVGGTMLRLCHGLNRFSMDLDFWLAKKVNKNKLFDEINKYFSQFYKISDSANKLNTLLFEFKSYKYPMNLKLEIRKEIKDIETEQVIAYSKYSNIQVLLRAPTLNEMMNEKINAFLERKEIRDIFDIEFLYKKGIEFKESPEKLIKILNGISSFSKNDYKVTLGSLLEMEQRKYYINENFKILKEIINEKLR
jgi:predicted nucleotidyltransferase component of viral defense system